MLRSLLRRSTALVLSLVATAPLARAFVVEPPTFPALVAESAAIVRAEVRAVESRRVTTPAGTAIKTFVTFEVARPLKGTGARTLTLSFLGGEVGDERWEVPGMPQFIVGDEEYLFVTPTSQICPLVGAMHGRYRVLTSADTGERYVARNDYQPLRSVADVAAPLHEAAEPLHAAAALAARPRAALSPAAFEQAIIGELTRHTRPELLR